MSEEVKTIVIKRGNMEIVNTERSNLIEVQSKYDGLVFMFKNNFTLIYEDNYLPTGTKDLIVNSTNSFSNASLIIDVLNYSKPVLAKIF